MAFVLSEAGGTLSAGKARFEKTDGDTLWSSRRVSDSVPCSQLWVLVRRAWCSTGSMGMERDNV